MAQWIGLGSGYTHTTAVKDAEQLVQHAVVAFLAEADPDKRRKKAKNVCHLAKRLLRVRIRFLKALITQRKVLREEDMSKRTHELTSLKQRLASMEEDPRSAMDFVNRTPLAETTFFLH